MKETGPGGARQTRTSQRRAWLVTAAVFIGILVVVEILLRALEPSLPPPLDWPTGNMQAKFEQMSALAEEGEEIDVAFVGSSIVAEGINPLAVSNNAPNLGASYNAGIAGAISTMAWRWWASEVVVPKLQPDLVVIGVASVDLNSSDPDVFWGPLTRSSGFNQVQAGTEGSFTERLENQIEEMVALFRLRTVLREPVRILDVFGDPLGEDLDIGPYGSESLDEEVDPYDLTTEGARLIREGQLEDFELEGGDLQELDGLVDELLAVGVDVVLVNMPVTDDYVDLHPNGETDYVDYRRTIDSLAQQKGIELLDFGRELTSVEYFRDPSHLNPEGVEIFSRLLATALTRGSD